jgi:hypothetical protein
MRSPAVTGETSGGSAARILRPARWRPMSCSPPGRRDRACGRLCRRLLPLCRRLPLSRLLPLCRRLPLSRLLPLSWALSRHCQRSLSRRPGLQCRAACSGERRRSLVPPRRWPRPRPPDPAWRHPWPASPRRSLSSCPPPDPPGCQSGMRRARPITAPHRAAVPSERRRAPGSRIPRHGGRQRAEGSGAQLGCLPGGGQCAEPPAAQVGGAQGEYRQDDVGGG